MSQDIRLYASAEVWEQEMQAGQRNLLRALIDFWPRGVAEAVDVGCGDGKLTQRLAIEIGTPIVGFDSSAEALSRVSLPTVQGDAADMPFGDASHDLVLSTDTLEHIPAESHDRVWSEIFRVARRHVMVAVPFREELLDATALCPDCGKPYHVNWHQRSYDMNELSQRAPPGWQVSAMVVSGEAWPEMLPAETQLRRVGLGQWSGWDMALCPHCGVQGHEPCGSLPLSPLLAGALGQRIYESLQERRVWRSHSEILCIYSRNSEYVPPSLPHPLVQARPASLAEPAGEHFHRDLISYPQVARCVRSADGELIVQFPLYEPGASLYVERIADSVGPVDASLEDCFGLLYSGRILESAQMANSFVLPRRPVPGQFGILLRTRLPTAIASLRFGHSPTVTWALPRAGMSSAYHSVDNAGVPLWVQVTGATWLDDDFWRPGVPVLAPDISELLNAMERLSEQRNGLLLKRLHESQAELDVVRVDQQNLQAGREALLLRAREADRLAVEVQNLQSERAALQQRCQEADRLAVEVQNLRAEREALLLRAREADRLAVDLQNVEAERAALQQRSQEADRLAVEVQNLRAEREALLLRAREADRLAVDVQNLEADRAALQQRSKEADRLTQELERLRAEKNAADRRAEAADKHSAGLQQVLDGLRARPECRFGDALRRTLGKDSPESMRKKNP